MRWCGFDDCYDKLVYLVLGWVGWCNVILDVFVALDCGFGGWSVWLVLGGDLVIVFWCFDCWLCSLVRCGWICVWADVGRCCFGVGCQDSFLWGWGLSCKFSGLLLVSWCRFGYGLGVVVKGICELLLAVVVYGILGVWFVVIVLFY